MGSCFVRIWNCNLDGVCISWWQIWHLCCGMPRCEISVCFLSSLSNINVLSQESHLICLLFWWIRLVWLFIKVRVLNLTRHISQWNAFSRWIFICLVKIDLFLNSAGQTVHFNSEAVSVICLKYSLGTSRYFYSVRFRDSKYKHSYTELRTQILSDFSADVKGQQEVWGKIIKTHKKSESTNFRRNYLTQFHDFCCQTSYFEKLVCHSLNLFWSYHFIIQSPRKIWKIHNRPIFCQILSSPDPSSAGIFQNNKKFCWFFFVFFVKVRNYGEFWPTR